jgi:putative membrane protein
MTNASISLAEPAGSGPGTVRPGLGDGRRALSGVRRPERTLLVYYVLQSIATGPGLIVLLPLRWFRYHTLRYAFDDEGVTVRWGLLFRREVSLTYARIQDIHLVSNLIERWLGLGRVQIQTASGQADAEMKIEGLHDYEEVRDELYRRMRGARLESVDPPSTVHAQLADGAATADVVSALNAAVAELRALRECLSDELR